LEENWSIAQVVLNYDLSSFSEVHGPTTALSITRELSIISATGKALHVYTKWTEDDTDQNSGTLISKSLAFHRRLPDYHPKYLTELLMHEEYDKVKKVCPSFFHL
jgi:hypothetical protein